MRVNVRLLQSIQLCLWASGLHAGKDRPPNLSGSLQFFHWHYPDVHLEFWEVLIQDMRNLCSMIVWLRVIQLREL